MEPMVPWQLQFAETLILIRIFISCDTFYIVFFYNIIP